MVLKIFILNLINFEIADQKLGVNELIKMLTNQETLKKIESIIITNNEQNELNIDVKNSDNNKMTSTLKSLILRENDNIRSRRKQRLHEKIKEEEEKYFNNLKVVGIQSTKTIYQNTISSSAISTTTTTTSAIVTSNESN
jgi:hypothetical protein